MTNGLLFILVAVLAGRSQQCLGALVESADEAVQFPQATLACKVKMGAIHESEEAGVDDGPRCDATCEVISALKGDCGRSVAVKFWRHANGFWNPAISDIKAGKAYLVMLNGSVSPYRIFSVMDAMPEVVKPVYGTKPGDKLLAEMVAMSKSSSTELRKAAVEQIGLMRDTRASDSVNSAAADGNAQIAKAGVTAQYRMKIAPDAKVVMQLFDTEVLDAWYEESGIPRRSADGGPLWENDRPGILSRGLPDFDYAEYVHEGIKLPWVQKDDHILYKFFGVPWKVQRQQCVPEFIALLDDPNKKVRYWACVCLIHTVEDKDDLRWEQYSPDESTQISKWKRWWDTDGEAFMKLGTNQTK